MDRKDKKPIVNLLLIDDNPDEAGLARLALRKDFDVKFKYVSKLEDIKRELQPENISKYEAVITDYDLKLGEFTGLSVLQLLKKNNIDIATLVVSGVNIADRDLETITNNADYFVNKDDLNIALPIYLTRALDNNKLNKVINSIPLIYFCWGLTFGWPVRDVSKNVSILLEDFDAVEKLKKGELVYADLIHRDDLKRIENGVKYNLEHGIDSFSQEYRLVIPTDTKTIIKYIKDSTTIKRDLYTNEPVCAEGLIQDITAETIVKLNLETQNKAYKETTKELKGLYSLSTLISKSLNLNVNRAEKLTELFTQFSTDVVPASMMYPEDTVVQLIVSGKTYTNITIEENSEKIPDMHFNYIASTPLLDSDKPLTLKIGYLNHPEINETSEQKLIEGYIRDISNFVNSSFKH